MTVNWIDLLLVLLVLLSVFHGWRVGFVLAALDLLRWLGSFLAALFLYQPLVNAFAGMGWELGVWSQPSAFLLILLTMGTLIHLAGRALLKRLPRDLHRRRANRVLGVLPGLANGFVTAAIAAALLFAAPLSDRLSESVWQSWTANRLAVFADRLEAALVPIFGDAVAQTLNRRTTVEPGTNERVDLPFTVENPSARPELEAQMLELINRERAAEGLGALEADPELTEVARRHSIDMFARGYFAHQTPENASPFDRMRQSNVKFRTAGENLALAPTVNIAHTGLMNSPGHRANILRPAFGRVGIGIMDGGRRGLMVTQNFRN